MSTPVALLKAKAQGLKWAVVEAPKKHPFPNTGATLYQSISGTWVPIMMGHPIVMKEMADAQNEPKFTPRTFPSLPAPCAGSE